MLVGPSIAPMMPTDAASLSVKTPLASAISMTPKMPNWPAAPTISIFGFESSGAKSVIAPMPMKSSSGNNSVSMPARYSG